MRTLLRWCGVGLVLAGCAGDETGPPPPPSPVKTLSATPSASGNDQSGEVTTTLPLPLRVVVDSAGTKVPGVHVNWGASSGTLVPASGVTDAAGIATATWTLDTLVGTKAATATLAGSSRTVTFHATAIALGPAATIAKAGALSGDKQTVGVNADRFLRPLIVSVLDQGGVEVPGHVTWTIVNGPVAFIEPAGGGTDLGVVSSVRLRPLGSEGSALVRATLDGTPAAADFTLTVGPPEYVVRLGTSAFTSVQNSSTNPAVDTIPLGQTVVWMHDYDDERHRVVSVGTPSFPTPGDFPFYAPTSKVSVTFTVPGTYHYADFYNSAATGVIVVR